ncbi:MAG: D-aminoacyl-tRNA deacylase [Hydrogenothermaceae bacterium]|nr:D-aminoacyl-tRNA deacylase [Hydrogenothermaceae bacterium]
MIALVQRVLESSVEVQGRVVGKIGRGLNILLGVCKGDTELDVDKLVNKIVNLRLFEDESKRMNLSVQDVQGEVLVVSQFTLVANLRKGRRPSFETAAESQEADRLYRLFIEKISNFIRVQSGVFGVDMKVYILNDGPVTFILNSKEL